MTFNGAGLYQPAVLELSTNNSILCHRVPQKRASSNSIKKVQPNVFFKGSELIMKRLHWDLFGSSSSA